MRMLRVAFPLLAVALTGCVAPAFSVGAYEGKAAATADDAVSAIESAILTATVAADGKAFGPYVMVEMREAEDAASWSQQAFDSMQPPDDPKADQLKSQLDDMLTQAVSIIEDLRIAARRGQLQQLPQIAKPLEDLSKKLDDFAQAHS